MSAGYFFSLWFGVWMGMNLWKQHMRKKYIRHEALWLILKELWYGSGGA